MPVWESVGASVAASELFSTQSQSVSIELQNYMQWTRIETGEVIKTKVQIC